jgi:hypothetical protein
MSLPNPAHSPSFQLPLIRTYGELLVFLRRFQDDPSIVDTLPESLDASFIASDFLEQLTGTMEKLDAARECLMDRLWRALLEPSEDSGGQTREDTRSTNLRDKHRIYIIVAAAMREAETLGVQGWLRWLETHIQLCLPAAASPQTHLHARAHAHDEEKGKEKKEAEGAAGLHHCPPSPPRLPARPQYDPSQWATQSNSPPSPSRLRTSAPRPLQHRTLPTSSRSGVCRAGGSDGSVFPGRIPFALLQRGRSIRLR